MAEPEFIRVVDTRKNNQPPQLVPCHFLKLFPYLKPYTPPSKRRRVTEPEPADTTVQETPEAPRVRRGKEKE